MTRTFSKTTSDSPLKLTALCIAIALGLLLESGPSFADDAHLAAADLIEMSTYC